jgi:hypothetical protein
MRRVSDDDLDRIVVHERDPMKASTGRGSIIPNLALDLRDCRALLAKAEAALKDVEWGPLPAVETSECPWCMREKRQGHDGACGLLAALRQIAESRGVDTSAQT